MRQLPAILLLLSCGIDIPDDAICTRTPTIMVCNLPTPDHYYEISTQVAKLAITLGLPDPTPWFHSVVIIAGYPVRHGRAGDYRSDGLIRIFNADSWWETDQGCLSGIVIHELWHATLQVACGECFADHNDPTWDAIYDLRNYLSLVCG